MARRWFLYRDGQNPSLGPSGRCPKLLLFGQSATGTPPSDADLSLIRSPACGGYPALRDLTPQHAYVRRMVLANDAVDRSHDHSTLPVVPGLERPEDGQAHYAGILRSLAPEGHMETVLAERIALQLWRLHRVARNEALSLITAQEAAERDVLERLRGGPAADPPPAAQLETVQQQLAVQRERLRPFEQFRLMGDEVPLSGPEAEVIVAAVEEITRPINRSYVPLPFLVPDQSVDQYPDWTAGKLRQLLDVISLRACRSVFSIFQQIIDRCAAEVAKLEQAAADLTARAERERAEFAPMLQREQRGRLLPAEPEMEKVTRYEAHLSRELYKAMHELEALQARRCGRPAPVARLDVTGMPDTPKLRNELAV